MFVLCLKQLVTVTKKCLFSFKAKMFSLCHWKFWPSPEMHLSPSVSSVRPPPRNLCASFRSAQGKGEVFASQVEETLRWLFYCCCHPNKENWVGLMLTVSPNIPLYVHIKMFSLQSNLALYQPPNGHENKRKCKLCSKKSKGESKTPICRILDLCLWPSGVAVPGDSDLPLLPLSVFHSLTSLVATPAFKCCLLAFNSFFFPLSFSLFGSVLEQKFPSQQLC